MNCDENFNKNWRTHPPKPQWWLGVGSVNSTEPHSQTTSTPTKSRRTLPLTHADCWKSRLFRRSYSQDGSRREVNSYPSLVFLSVRASPDSFVVSAMTGAHEAACLSVRRERSRQ